VSEEAEIGSEAVIDIGGDACIPPLVFIDPTARLWNPNDQTYYTAGIYGAIVTNAYGDEGYEIPERQNYFFQGELLTYYIGVYDENGADDIDGVNLLVDGIPHGSCAERDLIDDYRTENGATLAQARNYMTDHFSLDPALDASNDYEYYKFFACTLIVQSSWNDTEPVSVQAYDGGIDACEADPNYVVSLWTDLLDFNPSLALALTGGPVDFGSTSPGSTAISTTVYLENDAEDGSGVVMDMYIAADDYFADPTNPSAFCGTGNGIPYYQFKYYATKGSINSGSNDNFFPALGATVNDPNIPINICTADVDEFTYLTSHSGEIDDMCRILNWERDWSLLNQGGEMSITFKLEVPDPCYGNFTDGQFRFVGRVV